MSSEQSIFERESRLVIRISNVEYKLRLEIAKKHCPNFRLYSKTILHFGLIFLAFHLHEEQKQFAD